MTTRHTVARRSGVQALRIAAIAGCAAALAGCYTTPQTVTGEVASDVRQRHPIVLSEGPRTIELFIGDKRGTLTGSQRAQGLAFASEWGREATGGILIDVPTGPSNAMAGANAAAEVRSILAAAGVPPQVVEMRENRPSDPAKLATLRLHYPRVSADA